MSKNSFFTGQPIFSQILSLLPKGKIQQISLDHNAERYCKKFTTHAHLVTLLYAVYNRCDSLREVATGLLAAEQKLNHLGLTHFPRRSTISDANSRRQAEVFEAIYAMLYKKYHDFLPDSRGSKRSKRTYIVDSTSIALFQEILNGTGVRSLSGKRKGGVKVHTLIRTDEDVPQLVRMSARSANDSPFLKEIRLPANSILIFDRGYNNFTQWNRLDEQQITWITRLRKHTTYRTIEQLSVSDVQKKKGVISDEQIDIGHTIHKKAVHVKARLIRYKDPATDTVFEFITNSKTFAPYTIADFYKKRWQIEVLFKRLKQNYPLRNFLGESENAIKVQIWSTLIADLLLKIIKQTAAKKWAFSNLVAMIRLHIFTYIDLFSFLKNPEKALRLKKKITPPLQLFPT